MHIVLLAQNVVSNPGVDHAMDIVVCPFTCLHVCATDVKVTHVNDSGCHLHASSYDTPGLH